MFIIKNGEAYKIIDDKAFKIDFDENENVIVSKDSIEFDKEDKLYTYNEIYRKLNVKYFTQLKKLAPKKSSFKSEQPKVEKPKNEVKKEEE